MSAEAKGVGHGIADARLLGGVGNKVDAGAFGIDLVQIDGRRQGAGFDRLDAGDRLCNAACAHHVTGRALGRADIGESTAENLLDRGSLYRVTLVGGGAVRVDVADVGGSDACLGDRLTDARLGASARQTDGSR